MALSKVSESDTVGISRASVSTAAKCLLESNSIPHNRMVPIYSTDLDLITQIFVDRLTQCTNRFQPLYFSKSFSARASLLNKDRPT